MTDFEFVIDDETGMGYGTSDVGREINIVFISEGYSTEDDMSDYMSAVYDIRTRLLGTPPFNRYDNFFNVKWIKLKSPTNQMGNTALDYGLYYGTTLLNNYSQDPSMLVNIEKVRAVIEHEQIRLSGEGEADVIVIVVNRAFGELGRPIGINGNIMGAMPLSGCTVPELLDHLEQCGFPVPRTPDGGADFASASGIAITNGISGTVNGILYERADIAIHEFGHAFAGLGDEYYDHSGKPLAGTLSMENQDLIPNLIRLTEDDLNFYTSNTWGALKDDLPPAAKKWGDWIDDTTTVPIPEEEASLYPNATGLFIGGGYMYPADWEVPRNATYRPQFNCMMKELGQPFCSVCREAIVRAIYSHPDVSTISSAIHESKPVIFHVAQGSYTLSVSTHLRSDVVFNWDFSPPSLGVGVSLSPPTVSDLSLTEDKGGVYAAALRYRFFPDWTECLASVKVHDVTSYVKDWDTWNLMTETTGWQVHVEFEPVLADSPWPAFQHDMQRTGRCQEIGPFNPFVEWIASTEVSDFPGPVIGEGGTLYIAGKDRDLLALDRDTGEIVWQFHHAQMSSALVGVNGVIYAASERGSLFALESANSDQSGGIDNTIDNAEADILIQGALAIGKGGTVYLPWAERIEADEWHEEETKKCHLCAAYKTDSETLETRWDSAFVYRYDKATPAISEEGIVYIAHYSDIYKGNLRAISPDGEHYWTFEIGTIPDDDIGTSGTLMGPVVGKDGIVYVAMGRCLFAVQPDGQEKWRLPMEDEISAHPVISESGAVYVAAGNEVRALNSHSGSQIWATILPAGAMVSCMALDGNGTLYAGSWDRYLYGIVAGGQRMKWQIPSDGVPTSISIGERETIYIVAGNQLLAVTEALGVEGSNCDIHITDEHHRTRGIKDFEEGEPYSRPIPGATYETESPDSDGVRYISKLAIPHPVKNSIYRVTVTPRQEPGSDETYSLWVVEGTNRYPLAENVSYDDLPDEPYEFRYPRALPSEEIIWIGIRPEDLPVSNGQAIITAGSSGNFTAIGVDNLGREWVIPARWRLTQSVGELRTVKRVQAHIKASLRAGVRGLLIIKFRKMTARMPIRVVSGRQRRRR